MDLRSVISQKSNEDPETYYGRVSDYISHCSPVEPFMHKPADFATIHGRYDDLFRNAELPTREAARDCGSNTARDLVRFALGKYKVHYARSIWINGLRSPYDTLANTQPEDMEMQKLVNKVQTEWHRRSDPHQGNGKKKVNEVQEDVDEVDDYSDSGDMVEAVKRPQRKGANNKRGAARRPFVDNGKFCTYCKIPNHDVTECRRRKAKQPGQNGGQQGQRQQQGRPKQVLNPPLDPAIAKMISSCSITQSTNQDFLERLQLLRHACSLSLAHGNMPLTLYIIQHRSLFPSFQ